MKTVKELHTKAVEIYGKETVFKELRRFYVTLLKSTVIVKKVLDDLNTRTGSAFRASTLSHRKHIVARMREGASLEDFIAVNDVMSRKWKGTEMQAFLRPSTLYNSEKFEGYLSEHKRFLADEKAKQEKIQKKILEEQAKLGKTVRTGFKAWDSFNSYQDLWSYVAQMNQMEFENYKMPKELRRLQGEFLVLKLNGHADQAETTFKNIKGNNESG